MKSLLAVICIFSLSFWSCKKDEPITLNSTLKLAFEYKVNDVELHNHGSVLHKFVSPSNDTFTISQFKFYISNVKFINSSSNSSYTEPNSYHLLGYDNGVNISEGFSLNSIPKGTYDKLQFSLGVDSLANFSIAKLGDLDPNNNMAWDWNTGYKFFLLEGNLYRNSTVGGLVFHLGGPKIYKTLTFDLNINGKSGLEIGSNSYNINFVADVNAAFKSPNLIDFKLVNEYMGQDGVAQQISENYAKSMFSLSVSEANSSHSHSH
jgi:hypothetical protein